MDVVVDVLFVEQVVKCSKFDDWKGCTPLDPEFIVGLNHFDQNDIVQVEGFVMNCCVVVYLGTILSVIFTFYIEC